MTNRFREPEDTLKFVPTQVDRDVYRSIAFERKIPKIDCLMVEAYNYFREQLLKGFDLNGDPVNPSKVLTTLEYCLQVVMINLGDNDDPYLIFESLNFKGEPLSQSDLVRNYLLMRFRHSVSVGGEQDQVYSNYWHPLEELLGDNLTEFLRHYAMKDGEDIKQGGIYAATKSRLKGMETPKEVEAEIKRMQIFGEYYAWVLHPKLMQKESLCQRLENIKELEVTTSYPLLIRLLDAHKTEKMSELELVKCLDLIESFFVRRAICSVPANVLNKLFLQWVKIFPAKDHFAWLLKVSSEGSGVRRFPTDAEFEIAFTTQPQYGRRTTRFILCRLELSFEHKEHVDLQTSTIEHIMPQTMTTEWQKRTWEGLSKHT